MDGYMTVEDCRKSLPIRISRRKVVEYIRAAGPEYYQEHRRQIFLTREQWAVVVAGIRLTPCSKSRSAGGKASFKSSERVAGDVFTRVQARLANLTRKPSDSE
jgi:hypothetical protein